MWKKISGEHKKRFQKMIYIVLPIHIIIGIFIGVGVVRFVLPDFQFKYIILIICLLVVPIYTLSVFAMYGAIQKEKRKEEKTIAAGKTSDVGGASRSGQQVSLASPFGSRKTTSP